MVEVAHDFVPKIKNWLLAQNIQNSFDTWHGKTCYAFSAGKSTCISTKRELNKKKKIRYFNCYLWVQRITSAFLPVEGVVNCMKQNINSNFLFPGTKGVAKAMKEISSGAQKWQGERWFSELSDKRMWFQFITFDK